LISDVAKKALSDLGLKGYTGFWSYCIIQAILKSDKDALSVNELSSLTYIHPDDILATLETLGVNLSRPPQQEPTIDMKNYEGLKEFDGCFECLDSGMRNTPEQTVSTL
jgi:hypothetical protein